MPALWPWILVSVISGAAGAGIGYRFTADRCEARVARMEADFAAAREAAAQESARRLAAAQEAESRAVHALQATKNRLTDTQRRLKETLYGLPTASRCGLSGPARGLLNAAIAAPGGLPAPAGEPARADAESPADPGADEAGVGSWIADAVALYGECRARLDALRQWDEVTHGR